MTHKVEEFHLAFGHLVRSTPGMVESSLAELRYALLLEEWNEFKVASSKFDLVGVADALCDLQYVLSGSVITFGLDDNYGRLKHLMGGHQTKEWPPLDLAQFRIAMMFVEALEPLKKAIAESDLEKIQSALDTFQAQIFRSVKAWGLGNVFEELFDEVHRSNMSKLCRTVAEARATVNMYRDRGIDSEVYEQTPYWAVRQVGGEKDGKILKGINYSQPDLQSIIDNR